MTVQRKCTKCNTWNTDNDFCTNCGELLNPLLIEEKREEEREQRRKNKPPTKLDLFVENWKNNKYWLIRATYYVLYSIVFTFFAIASFFAWLAASPNG